MIILQEVQHESLFSNPCLDYDYFWYAFHKELKKQGVAYTQDLFKKIFTFFEQLDGKDATFQQVMDNMPCVVALFRLHHPGREGGYFRTIQEALQFLESTKTHKLSIADLTAYLTQFAGRATEIEIAFLINEKIPLVKAEKALETLRALLQKWVLIDIRGILDMQKKYLESTSHPIHSDKLLANILCLQRFHTVDELLEIAQKHALQQHAECIATIYSVAEVRALRKAGADLGRVGCVQDRIYPLDVQLAKLFERNSMINWKASSNLPKALLLKTTRDSDAFKAEKYIDIVKAIAGGYNVQVRHIGDEKELWQVLQKTLQVAKVHLIMISGHGNQHNLEIALNKDLSTSSDRMQAITQLALLPPQSAIVLQACSTAAGGASANNLANWFARYAPQAKVIASSRPCINKVKITRHFPLELTFHGPVKVNAWTTILMDVTHVIPASVQS